MSWETNGSTWTRVSSQWLRKNVSAKSIYTPTSHKVEFSANIRQSWQSRYRTSDRTAAWKLSCGEKHWIIINDRKRQVNWLWTISNIPFRSTSKSKRKMSAVIWVPKKSKETVSQVKSLKKLRNVSFLQWVSQSEPNRSLPIASFATNLPKRFWETTHLPLP